jgi:RNA polymerase sigma factor (sigma-70 family)
LNPESLNLHHQLIERCKQGEEQAYFGIYKLYSKAMYNTAFRITGNEDDAEDVLQEAFISAFRNLAEYRGNATFGSWLKRIVINKAINALKKRKHERMPEEESFDMAEETEQTYMPELTVDRVREAVMHLPDGYRSVLSLYLLEGYDHQEIATIMRITESTSKSQLNRAKHKLKQLLTTQTKHDGKQN